jgi:hypothetical protein
LANKHTVDIFFTGAGKFSLHHKVQTGSGAHSASYTKGSRGLSLGVKRLELEADHSPPSSAEIKNAWSYTSTPQHAFIAWCSVTKKHRDDFTFTFTFTFTLPYLTLPYVVAVVVMILQTISVKMGYCSWFRITS